MTVYWAFNQLGIDPTTDTSQIRRAYARLLKAMDVDADVDGYARLRIARNQALAYAAGTFEGVAQEEPNDAQPPDESPPDSAHAGPPSGVKTEDAPAALRPRDEIALAQERLIALLFPGGEQMYYLTAEEAEEALRCFEFLKTDPRLEQIDTLGAAGDWFAQVIAQSLPRSDPLVRPAVAYFGWRLDEQVGVHPAVGAIVARASALDYRDRLQRRSHRLHRAWQELTRPANENSKRGWVSLKRVTELLKEVRARHPSLEGDFDWYRVTLWEGAPAARLSWRTGVFLAIFLFQVLRLALQDGTVVSSPQARDVKSVFSIPLTDAQNDIDKILTELTSNSIGSAKLNEANPKLYSMLSVNWETAKNQGQDFTRYRSNTRSILTYRLDRAWPQASYPVLKRKLEADMQIARELAAAECASFLAGQLPVDSLSQSQLSLRRRNLADELLEIDPTKPPGPEPKETYSYRIPGAVIAEGITRSGLTREQFSRGLDLDPPVGIKAEVQCAARLALREAILAQPRKNALEIMRDMQD